MRLDQAIAFRNPGISRRKARELIAARRVLVNERIVAVASRHVEEGDRVTVVDELPQLRVIASTPDWIAIDKPTGMPAQPTADRKTRSLEELLRVGEREIYLVHRLDTPTSGVILFARSRAAAAELSRLFAGGAIRKTYLAMTGAPIGANREIGTPIDGKEALTIVRPLRGNISEIEIQTGRMHQIRIHLASIGHPVSGDRRYGGAAAPRLMLHAWKLEHESLGELVAPPPPEFGL